MSAKPHEQQKATSAVHLQDESCSLPVAITPRMPKAGSELSHIDAVTEMAFRLNHARQTVDFVQRQVGWNLRTSRVMCRGISRVALDTHVCYSCNKGTCMCKFAWAVKAACASHESLCTFFIRQDKICCRHGYGYIPCSVSCQVVC